jgi:preprotein translocase subunit SecE
MATLVKDKDDDKLPSPPGDAGDSARKLSRYAPPNVPASGGGGSAPPKPVAGGGGYFHIYKKGQGYWTRMGTVGGVALVGALTMQFIFSERNTFRMTDGVAEAVCGGFALVYALIAFYVMNRPGNVDFLIATDSEMKKVNWTSRKELMGSTKVVILFMFILAAFLFVMDLLFGYFFWMIGVLKEPPI